MKSQVRKSNPQLVLLFFCYNPLEEAKGEPEVQAEAQAELQAELQAEGEAEGQPMEKPDKVEAAARKTFITDKQAEAGEYKPPFTIHDLLIPGGKPAKLARIPDPKLPDLRLTELLFRFKFRDPTPVIMLVGGWGARAYDRCNCAGARC